MIFAKLFKKNAMKKIILLSLSLVSFSIFSQIKTTSTKNLRSLSGFVFDNQYPLSGVNLLIKNSTRGTTTNKKGFFTIQVATNEIIQFSHLGYRPLKILVEDFSKTLKIQLKAKNTILEEVTIKTKLHTVKPKSFYRIGRGLVNIRRSSYIKGTDLNPAALTLGEALRGKFSGLKIKKNKYGDEVAFIRGFSINSKVHAIWDVDGIIFESAPPIGIDEIKSIVVLKSLAETILYGSEGAGGVIIVTTTTGDGYDNLLRNVNSKENPHTNKNYYNRDAILFKDIKQESPQYHTELDTAISIGNALRIYKTLETRFNTNSNFYMDMVRYFDKRYKNKNYTRIILRDFEEFDSKNPETLKSVAYKYQELNLHLEALLIYKKLMKIKPNHAQSYRDLANAYVHLKQYKNAWKIYTYYLKKGFLLEKNPIGKMMTSEMKALYLLRKEDANINDKLAFPDLDVDDTSDVRIVFEWNTSDAEFSFEFVNQNEQSYVVDHTLYESNDLIIDEKLKGYNSTQYIINPISEGDWLVNLNYYGNKEYTPTFLKVTTYYNWGRVYQTETIKVFELSLENRKTQLFKINSKT